MNNSSTNKNSNLNNHNLIKNQFNFNKNQSKNYNTHTRNTKAHTPQKILEQLHKTEFELARNLSKLIKKEKIIKEKSYMDLINNENYKDANYLRNKELLELNKISENKKIYSSQLNEIKLRINSLQDKYNKEKGISNNNYKERLDNYIQSQFNIKNNSKINSRLKILQRQNEILLSNMNTDAEKKIKEKEDLINQQEQIEIENNKNLLEKIRKEEKEEIMKRKNNNDEEIKKVKEYINNKPEKKEYLYQKNNEEYNQKMKKIYISENTKRKNLMKSMETSDNNEFIKNYQILKVKKNLELKNKIKMLKKSWSERELLLPKYKSELSILLNEEEKNKKNEKQMDKERKNMMKIKQIKFSNKYEDNLSTINKKYNSFNKSSKNKNRKINIKFNYMNNYCDLIRNKPIIKSSIDINKNSIKLKPNNLDLTKNQNIINITKINKQNVKLPNLISNKDQKNKRIVYPILSKNNNIYKFKNKEIKNIIEKNGINNATLNVINSKLENLNQKKEQKELLLKYQGGIASNPDLDKEISDILIDTIESKMNLIEGMNNLEKNKNKNLIENDIIENEEEEEIEENQE